MTTGYSLPPIDMAQIGDTFWPAGLPKGTSAPAYRTDEVTERGRKFSICYSQQQIQSEYKQKGFFSPYISVHISPPLSKRSAAILEMLNKNPGLTPFEAICKVNKKRRKSNG